MSKEVATPSAAYEEQEQSRLLPRLLMAGTPELRKSDNAKTFLPPEEEEEVNARGVRLSEWDQRVRRAVIYPFFSRAVRRAVAAIFARPVVLQQDVPARIREIWEDVDLAGNIGDVFFGRVMEDSLGDAGLSYVLVEHPEVAPGSTLADLLREGKRPYLVHVKARQVIGVQHIVENGRIRYKTARIRESYTEPGEWEDTKQTQIRVLRSATPAEAFCTWEVWRKTDPDREDSYAPYSMGTMEPHVEIPIRPLYTGFLAPDRAVTPFEDLGFLNILHTQKENDLDESFRISLGAQLHRSGIKPADAAKQRAIGAKRQLVTENPEGRAEWLERSGSAAKIALEAQDRLENRMRALSSEPHIRRTGDETATGRAIDEIEAKTETQAWALSAQDTIEACFQLLAQSLGESTGGSVTVRLPPRLAETDNEVYRLMLETHKVTGAPSVEAMLEVLKNRGALPDEVDIEEEAMRAAGGTPGPGARIRSTMRTMMERSGMSEEEIESALMGMEEV